MYWTRYRTFVVASVLAVSAYGLVRGEMPQVETGTWRAIGALGSVRAGAASALLTNGDLLVTGGAGSDGALASAEVLGSSGTFSPVASMNTARWGHAALTLDDGRVIVVGGRNADGAVASAEIYSGGEWSAADDLTDARWGHTATLLADGRVLIAGGENAAGVLASVELFDPNTDSFYVAGTLSSPRKGHAAARLADGRVLIAGGFSGDAVLSSIDVFDPETDSISQLGLSLGTARAGLSATTLLDGKVLFFGGNDGSNDLATSEVFNPAAGTVTAGASAPVARRDHSAFLLPNNNAVLIVGGATADGASASAELYIPWLNQFWSTSAPAAPRYRATVSSLSKESYGDAPAGAGLLAVAGGEGQSSAEAYGFATISVDKNDYLPGDTVYVSGRGWQPGDVTFELREVVAEHTPRLFTLTADEHGMIPKQQLFLVEQHHLGVRFYLTAHDAASQAQITFSDGNATSVSGTVVSNAPGNPAISGAIVVCTSGCNNSPAATVTSSASGDYIFDNGTTKLSFATNGPVTVKLTASKSGFVSETITLTNVSNGVVITGANFSLDRSIAPTDLTTLPVAGTYGGTVVLSATLVSGNSAVSGKSIAFRLNDTPVGTATTNASGTATLANVSLSGINAGTYTGAISASFAGDSGFAASSGTGNLTVNALSVNLTGTRTYDGTTTAAASILTISNRVGSDAVTVATGNATLASKDVGSRAMTTFSGLTLGGPSAANYTLTGATGAVTITPRIVQLTGTRPYDGTADVAASVLSVSNAAAGDSVNVASGTATVASKDVGARAITALGTLTLGNNASGNYTLSGASGTVTITARAVALTGTRAYDGTADAPASILTISNAVAGDSVNVASGTATLASKNAGPQAITNFGALALGNNASGNYTLTGASGTVTITSRAVTLTGSRVYDGTVDAAASILSVSNAVAGETVNVASGTATLAAKDVGARAITSVGTLALGNNGAGNYTLTGATGTVAITVRPITFKADDITRVYGESTPAFGYSVTAGSIVNGDTFGAPSFSADANTVGTHVITLAGLANTNYTVTLVDGTLDVTPRPITFKADDVTRLYGESTPAFGYSVTAGSIVNGDTFGAPTFSADASTVGTHVITLTGLANTNYTVTLVDGTLDVTPRPITFKADDITRVYGETTPPFTYTIAEGSVVNGDEFGSPSFSVPANTAGTHVITLSGLANTNYAVTFVKGTLTVTPRSVTVIADAQSKVYGDDDPALTYKITNGSLVNGDVFTGALARAQGQNIGTYAIQQGTLALNDNYRISYIGSNLTIALRPITVTADAKTKVYGYSDPALTYQVTTGSVVSGDSFTGTLTRASGENVGTYVIQQGTVALNSNYALTYVGANLTITARPITVTADAKTKVYGSGDPALTYQLTSGTLVGADAFAGALTRAAGQNVGAYAIEQGSLALSTNYSLRFVGAELTITRATLTVTADNKQKVYDASPFTAFTSAITGFVNGDTAAVVSGTVSYDGAAVAAVNPGTYTITPLVSGLTALNYTFTQVNGTLTITYGACSPTLGAGGVVLPPINSDGSSVYQRKGGSTIPVKFRVCGASGQSISNPAAVFAVTGGSLTMLSAVRGTVTIANETAIIDIPDVAFRWDPSGQQWIFNMATSNLESGTTYSFSINLKVGNIPFRVGVK